MVEGILDFIGCFTIPLAHIVHGGIREDNAPTERVVGTVAFDHGDIMASIQLLHQHAEIQTCRTTTDAYDLHDLSFNSVASVNLVYI